MITEETLKKLARQYQTDLFPNVLREYFQHLFLEHLYPLDDAGQMLFKGGTALRILYGSPRFSEDLDFSASGVSPAQIGPFAEGLFVQTLAGMERLGIEVEIGAKSATTSGGYFGVATFEIPAFRPLDVEINVSTRGRGGRRGEVDTVANDFVPTYNVVHLPQLELVEEKIFGALRERKKPRDFYDLYYLLRKGMLTPDQKKRLAAIKDEIVAAAKQINFRGELGAFLPVNQQTIIRDFSRTLEAELGRQTGN